MPTDEIARWTAYCRSRGLIEVEEPPGLVPHESLARDLVKNPLERRRRKGLRREGFRSASVRHDVKLSLLPGETVPQFMSRRSSLNVPT